MSDTISWIDANSTETVLSGQTNVQVLFGRAGFLMPPARYIDEQVPQQHGRRLRSMEFDSREVDLPIIFFGSSASDLRQRMRVFLSAFNPAMGEGKLRAIAPDGEQRELYCRYVSGATGNEGVDQAGGLFLKMVLSFRAFDPFWYARNAISISYTTADAASGFFPFFPLRLSSSTVFSNVTIVNSGDVEAWPVWIIKGPGTNPALKNLTTGKSAVFAYTLAGGETITLDTRPEYKSVVKNDGTNLFSYLTGSLWPLAVESNAVQIEMNGATAASEVALTYYQRYLSL